MIIIGSNSWSWQLEVSHQNSKSWCAVSEGRNKLSLPTEGMPVYVEMSKTQEQQSPGTDMATAWAAGLTPNAQKPSLSYTPAGNH